MPKITNARDAQADVWPTGPNPVFGNPGVVVTGKMVNSSEPDVPPPGVGLETLTA